MNTKMIVKIEKHTHDLLIEICKIEGVPAELYIESFTKKFVDDYIRQVKQSPLPHDSNLLKILNKNKH